MSIDLTNGPVTKKMMLFSLPLIAGNLLQQTYNIADTVIVGRFLGADALAAVGSSYTLMTFLTSILLGLCMGSGALFSIRYGEKNEEKLKESIGTSFLMIAAVALLLNVLVCRNTEWILEFLQVPQQVYDGMRTYLEVVFTGMLATFLYNYFASLLRAAGESLIPLIFLAICAGLNIVLDLCFVIGLVVMAAFAAAVKIDSFAYMPVQDFGNAFSTFVAQNYGAGKQERIREGARKSVLLVLGFCLVISASVFVFAKQLLLIFVQPYETEILAVGIQYLRIEGAFYFGIGFLFLFYGYYRAVRKPGMSVVLTVISLGTRVVLAYVLSAVPQIGVSGIWSAVPIGWILADIAGWIYYKKLQQR